MLTKILLTSVWAGPIPEAKPLPQPVDTLPNQDEKFRKNLAGPLWSKDGPVVTIFYKDLMENADIGIGKGESGKSTDKVEIKLTTENDEQKTFQVEHKTSTVGIADGLTNWWPAAIKSGVMEMGGYRGIKKNSIQGGFPSDALRFLTGKEIQELVNPFTKGQAWEWLKNSNNSPMCLGTQKNTKKLMNHHAYAIMSYDGDNAENARARLRDPNNGVEWYDLKDILDDINHLAGLKGFASVP
ncbi:uncharacterized protein L201_003404 [Kwoniella dendrophila CBS 6074]|uniref:Uncharacterized protein n=1 Tax=Kwoniella dendrophila CBS 6074 TaxID=1295534 RepID=A0AAX4JUL0_9TREE